MMTKKRLSRAKIAPLLSGPFLPKVWNISSMGRIIEKDKTEGWQYLKAILNFAMERSVKIINATVNDAGEKAFRELEINGGLPKNCRMEWSPGGDKKGVTLLIE